MPVGTNLDDTDRFDLKSAPPDGYVVLQRMSYGDKLARQAMVSKMQVLTSKGSKDVKAELDMMSRQTALFDFARCIVEHNLTDANDRLLDFKNSRDVEALNGRIGEEINLYIDRLNNFEEEDESNPEGNS